MPPKQHRDCRRFFLTAVVLLSQVGALPLALTRSATISCCRLMRLDVDRDSVDELAMLFEHNFSLRNADLAIYRDHYFVGPFSSDAAMDTADLDRDGREELLVVACDSEAARLTVWNPRTNETAVQGLALIPNVVPGPRPWGGTAIKVSGMAVIDAGQDGRPGLVVGGEIGGGSQAVRGLWAFSLADGRELWHCFTGIVPVVAAVTGTGHARRDEIIFQGYAISNGNYANGMGDDSSWVGCVSSDGRVLWKIAVGGAFTNPMVRLVDFDRDGRDEIVVAPGGGAAGERHRQRILVLDPGSGRIKAEASNPSACEGMVVADLNLGHGPELLVGGTDNTVRAYDRGLRLVRQADFSTVVCVLEAFSLDRRGHPGVLGVTGRKSVVLLDARLRLLAETGVAERIEPYGACVVRTGSGPRVLVRQAVAGAGRQTMYSLFAISSSPRTVPVWLFVLVVVGLLTLGTGTTLTVSRNYRAQMNSMLRGLVRGAAVVRLNAQGRVKSVNRPAIELLGFSGRARGLTFADLCSDSGLAGLSRFVADELRTGEGAYSTELTLSRPGSNTEQNVLVRVMRVRREFLVTIEGVSAVEYLRRVENWVPVARSLAHRIKSPLTTMKLLVRQIENRHHGQDPAMAEDTEAMKEEIDRLAKMTDGFMRMVRLDPPSRKPTDLHVVVSRALGRLPGLQQSGITVVQRLPQDLPAVLVDEEQLPVAIANVVENAVSAMSGDGTLSIRAQVLPGARQVELLVADTGTGMTEECRAKVFEPYYTTKRGGTGLGMAITRKIVEENGGEIAIASEVGRGTTVLFRLPSADRPKA